MVDRESRIQKRNKDSIMNAALEIFSMYGFRGATVDLIAKACGLSKPNLLYYFQTKEEIHVQLLSRLMDTWLDPLKEMDENGDPFNEIMAYVRRKLHMSKTLPRESRLFANEIIQGAPRINHVLQNDLKMLVDEKALVIQKWVDKGLIAKVHPYHLIFSIWSLTQHYADFDVQVQAVLTDEDPFENAESYLETLFSKLLAI